jgi:hypothetical protein
VVLRLGAGPAAANSGLLQAADIWIAVLDRASRCLVVLFSVVL